MKYRLLKELYDCSFISGFTLAWKLSAELNNYENERLASCQTGRLGARFISQKEHHKEETTWVIDFICMERIEYASFTWYYFQRKKDVSCDL